MSKFLQPASKSRGVCRDKTFKIEVSPNYQSDPKDLNKGSLLASFCFLGLALEKFVTTPLNKRIVVAENFWHSALKQQKKLEPRR
jgi:hypothetical protein